MSSLVEIKSVVLEKKNNFIVFLLFRNYFPLQKSIALCLNKRESALHTDALCQFLLKLAVVLEKRSFLFSLFPNDLPLK